MAAAPSARASLRASRPPDAGPLEGYSAEERILLTCARVRLDARHGERLGALLEGRIDWEQVLRVARWHRLSGLLFLHLRRPAFSGAVPADVLASLRSVYLVTAARHLRHRTEMERVLRMLHAEGIQVILLKGAALVGTLYPEPGVRPMGDLDLLVPRSRLTDAQTTVQRHGYVPAEEGREEHWQQHQHLPRLVSKAAVTIEVHGHVVRLDGPLAFDIQEFWDRARPLGGAGSIGSVLAPEDLVLHLCLNFFRDRRFHSRGALGQLCDLGEAVTQATLDWDLVVERGRRYRIGGPIACSLELARMLLDAPVAEGVVSSLAPGMTDRDVAAFARLRVVTTRSWVTTELVKPQERYGNLGLVRAILRRIVPNREYMRLHYGEAGFGTYWRRFGRAARVLASFVQRPSELTDDLSVDRWVHSLYEQSGRRTPLREHRT